MKKIVLIAVSLFCSITFAQTEYSAYTATGKGVASTFVTDYHCLGINPANLGKQWYPEKKFTMGTSEFATSIYSEALSRSDLRKDIRTSIKDKSFDNFTAAEKKQVAESFAANFAFNFDYNAFGVSYQNPKFGGIALAIRTRASWNSSLSNQFSDLLFRGKTSSYFDSLAFFNGTDTVYIENYENMSKDSSDAVISGKVSVPLRLSEILNGSAIKMSWNREFHIGYGRQLFAIDDVLTLRVGVGAKYIQGIAVMDLSADADGIKMYSAMSPGFDLNYGLAALSNPSTIPSTGATFFKSPVGTGYGLDVGVNATLFNKLHVAASITNVGEMKYTGNLYTVTDTLVVSYSQKGLQELDFSAAPRELLEENGLLKIQGASERKVNLPGQFRMGASIELGKIVHIGTELVAPFNDVPGNIEDFAFGIGGDLKLFKGKVILMTGVTGGGGYDTQLPVGVNIVLRDGSYELGVASRDAITFFTENKPTLSTAFGFARFRF